MTFLSQPLVRQIPGKGPKWAKIALVGEAGGFEEAKRGEPFVGRAGMVLEQCLHAAGLTRSECYITNVVKLQPPKNDISPYFNGRTFTDAGKPWLDVLYQELADMPDLCVTVALGKTACAALTGVHEHSKYRGYFLDGYHGLKVLPTIHPAAVLYNSDSGKQTAKGPSKYMMRYVISRDLRKASEHADTPSLVRPERELYWNFSSPADACAWIYDLGRSPKLSVDIEVLNYEVAVVGLADSPHRAIAVSLGDPYWGDAGSEIPIWKALADVLGDSQTTKIGQNFIFDFHFLASKCGLVVRGPMEDTMMAHSLTYPDLPKGLAFLGSCYCGTQAYWKDEIKFDNIKEEA